jgi:hypothetical protein
MHCAGVPAAQAQEYDSDCDHAEPPPEVDVDAKRARVDGFVTKLAKAGQQCTNEYEQQANWEADV